MSAQDNSPPANAARDSAPPESPRRLARATGAVGFFAVTRSAETLFLLRDVNAYAVLSWIAFHARTHARRSDGIAIGEAYLGRESLARELRLEPGQVRAALKRLENAGFVTIRASKRGSKVRLCGSQVIDIGAHANNQANANVAPTEHPPDNQENANAAASNGEEKNFREGEKKLRPTPRPSKESDQAWLARLASEWPGIDIPAELVKAHRKRRGDVERGWFERAWLPGVTPRAPHPSAMIEQRREGDPPTDWRARLQELFPDNTINPQRRAWSTVDPETQRLVREASADVVPGEFIDRQPNQSAKATA